MQRGSQFLHRHALARIFVSMLSPNHLPDTIADLSSLPIVPFPIPGATGEITARLLNTDLTLGPAAIVIYFGAGSRVPAHYHERTSEQHYVLEGKFLNAGVEYGPGGFFTHSPGTVHGPHGSETGCAILTVQPDTVDPRVFHIPE